MSDYPADQPAEDLGATDGWDPEPPAESSDEAPDESPESRGESSDQVPDQPRWEPTGHPDVDAALASLEDLDGRPVDEHVAVFESAHERLRGALSDAEAGTDRTGA